MKNLLKPFFAVAFVAFFAASCNNANEANQDKLTTDLINNPASASGKPDTLNLPKFEFDKETHDFGLITQGEKIAFSYKFKNSGKTNLIITSAKGSCGCTVPEYPKKPIPPGGEGLIEVVFDSEGKSGKQNKTVTILANTYPATNVLTLVGEIVVPDGSSSTLNE
jgi:hypothetical protein